jgi:FCP1-like phosphatase family protein
LDWSAASGYRATEEVMKNAVTQLGFYDLQIPCATKNSRHDRKLSLVLDLDQTLVHAMKLGELMSDLLVPGRLHSEAETFLLSNFFNNGNPKYVEAFTNRVEFTASSLISPAKDMTNEPRQLLVTCLDNELYFIKLRPGLRQFLAALAPLYELHIYTKANRNYLNFIMNELDPLGKLFSSAVARDDSPDLDTDMKILDRVCCRDLKEVIIFDDRVDVWNQTPGNVIRAQPYNFLSLKKYTVIKALEELVVSSRDPHAETTAVAIDYDCHLFYMKDLLIRVFNKFVSTNPPMPSYQILSQMKKHVLSGVGVQFTGFNDVQTLIKEAEDFGATCKLGQFGGDEIQYDDSDDIQVLVAAKHTKRLYDTKKESPKTRVVHWSWVEHVKATWEVANVSMFDHARFRMDEAGVYGAMDNWEVAWLAASAREEASEKGTHNSSREKRRRREIV